MVFNIVLDDIDLNCILPQVIILDICNLRVFITFLCQIIEVICLHLLDDLDQSVVESASQLQLLLVGARKIRETLHIGGMLADSRITQPKDLHDLLVNGLVLILGVMGELITLTGAHSCCLQSNDLTAPGCQLSCTSSAVIFLAVILLSSHEFSTFRWVVNAGASAGWIVRRQVMSLDISGTDQWLPLQILACPIVDLLWALWVIGLRTLWRLAGIRLEPSVEHDLNIIPNRYDKFDRYCDIIPNAFGGTHHLA